MMRFRPCLLLFLSISLLTIFTPTTSAQPSRGSQLKDSLKLALAHAKADTSKIKTLYLLADFYAPNDSATAFSYANQCLSLSQQIKWQKGVGLSYLAKAKIYEELTDFSKVIEIGKKAYDILKPLNDNLLVRRAVLIISVGYGRAGFYTKSIGYCLEALKLSEAVNSKTGISTAYNNLGLNYQYLGQYDKAIDNYKKALAIAVLEKYRIMIAADLGNIANMFEYAGKPDSAKTYNQLAIGAYEEINNLPGLDRTYNSYANVLVKLNSIDSALAYYNRSLAISKKLGIKDDISNTYSNMGEMYFTLATDSISRYTVPAAINTGRRAMLQQSASYLNRAITLANEVSDLDILKYCYNILAETATQLGNYKEAFGYYKKYTLYKDSIFNDENRQKIAAMESERLTATKDQEIALQAADARRQALLKRIVFLTATALFALGSLFALVYNRRKKARFDKEVMEVEMKALRAQMNPHFISNALHSINKYVMENDKKNASGYLAKFASLMRLILENSREREVPLEQDLHALELYIQMELLRFNNSFTYKIEIDPEIDPENTLVPPMLLQPFAENAILHGLHNKENGIIKIQVHKQNDMICYVIEDNGNGNIEGVSSANADGATHKSFGKKIVNERLNIINRLKKAKATVNIFQLKDAANKPGGVRVELLLPIELAF